LYYFIITTLGEPKKQKQFYSGKKKRHTLKSQLGVNKVTREIICTAHGKGKEHDFCIFRNSKTRLKKNIKLFGDKGYRLQSAAADTFRNAPRSHNRPLHCNGYAAQFSRNCDYCSIDISEKCQYLSMAELQAYARL
jgi:hypothetical protein